MCIKICCTQVLNFQEARHSFRTDFSSGYLNLSSLHRKAPKYRRLPMLTVLGSCSVPGQARHCNRLVPKSSGRCFAYRYTEAASRTHGLSLPGLCVCQVYSLRVSMSSRMRPIEQNQNQNSKTKSKKKKDLKHLF